MHALHLHLMLLGAQPSCIFRIRTRARVSGAEELGLYSHEEMAAKEHPLNGTTIYDVAKARNKPFMEKIARAPLFAKTGPNSIKSDWAWICAT